jgi:lysophospholipase L1-like esterase
LGSLARRLQPSLLTNLNLAACSLFLTLGLAEGGLRLYLPPADKYYVRHPNIHSIFNPYPGTMPGVSGESHFITNSEGMRGSEFSSDDNYRILVFGGSTTECLYLDQTEAWPQLVQDRLNQNGKDLPVWVGNVGKSGNTSREHVLQFRHLLAQYPNIDTAILLVGGNDLNLRLARGDGYTPDYLADPGLLSALMRNAFRLLPQRDPNARYYEQTAIGRMLGILRQSQTELNTTAAIEVEDNVGKIYNNRRKERKNAPIEETLPDLTSGLGEYSRNLNTIIDLAQAHQVRLILLTQPSMYRSDLTPEEKDLLWFGWSSGRKFYYSVEAMAEGLARYNQKLLEVCQQRQVECVDLASALPKDTTIFYDDLHFNENGAAQVAKIVADYMAGRAP